ncbi:hypothetical protein [Mucilaginibacter defluvii]|uniref:Fimbrillin-like protein n=1 Tax=Mucilaginibacter defluvii TaxID=1196019 RepID=A0ABP9FVC3_9SPHI
MRTIVNHILLLALLTSSACGQTKTLNGVYAGLEVVPSAVMGGGMDRYDNAFLFRPNGTFTDKLEETDWKTRVDGSYTVSGKNITLKFTKSGRTHQYKLDSDGNIDAGGYSLVYQPSDSSIPAGVYEFSKMSSSGGGSSGTVYVGVGTDNTLRFDGKGHFSNNKARATAVIGNVGGGSSRKSSGEGTYTINKGLLTLKFDNGKTETHSFFCRPAYKPIMAVIDGGIFFMKNKEGQEDKSTAGNKTGNAAIAESKSNRTGTTETTSVTDPKEMLLKANAVHGGTILDDLKFIGFTATMQGLKINSYVDIAGQRLRLEVRQNEKLVQVEQVEGQKGWMWQQDKISQLPANRVSEMRAAFSSGILGLRKEQLRRLSIKNIKAFKAGNAITTVKDGKQFVFMLNEEFQLVGEANNAGKSVSSSVYKDLRTSNGLLLPFQETASSGVQKNVIRYDKYEVNITYPETIWDKP